MADIVIVVVLINVYLYMLSGYGLWLVELSRKRYLRLMPWAARQRAWALMLGWPVLAPIDAMRQRMQTAIESANEAANKPEPTKPSPKTWFRYDDDTTVWVDREYPMDSHASGLIRGTRY